MSDDTRKIRRDLIREVVQGEGGVLQTVHGGLDPRNLVPLPHVEGDGRIKIVLSPSSRKMSPAEQERNDQKLIALARRVARRR